MEDRLGRLEQKIDSLQEAVISLARVEERLITVFNRQSKIESEMHQMHGKMDELSERMAQTLVTERIMWIFVTAAIGAAFNFMG